MRSEQDVENTIECYADTVKRICMLRLKNTHDTEDIFQNVFLKYMMYDGSFECEEHRKAWLLRVAINACTDQLRFLAKQSAISFEELTTEIETMYGNTAQKDSETEILRAVLSLPVKYRDAIYLHYYEGYSAAEIGEILGKKENAVYSLLSRGRTKLKSLLGGSDFE